MKQCIISFFIFVFASANIIAQDNETIYVKSVRFATPLLEKWIAEYSKLNPDIQIAIAGKDIQPEEIDIHLLISDTPENDLLTNPSSFAIGRYAILPIAGKNNALLNDWKKKKLNAKRLKELFFERDIFAEDYEPEKDKDKATVYSVNSSSSVSGTFAGHFSQERSNLKGKKISGDDIYLISAIQKDDTGVSFNPLNYIYDIDSRQLKENIAILPLDLKKEDKEIIETSGLDETIALLERKSIDIIPVEELFFVLQNTENQEIQSFLRWVLLEGQAFNHPFGLLELDKKTANRQLTANVF
jgi:ABC-type phosphate transport system substrate-binding protein